MIFEVLEEDSLLVVDGELVPTAPVYAEVHKGLVSVFVDPQNHRLQG